MSLTTFVRAAPEWRPMRLHCRFVTNASPRPEEIEAERLKATDRFVDDMARQGWRLVGAPALVGGPFPATPRAAAVPKAPPRRTRRLGPRDTRPDPYPEGVVKELPTLLTTDAWEYELAGVFVRPLMPSEVLVEDLPTLTRRSNSAHVG